MRPVTRNHYEIPIDALCGEIKLTGDPQFKF